MPLFDMYRFERLRQEIRELRTELLASQHQKSWKVQTQRQEQFQRLEEIREELQSLMQAKKSA